MTADIELLPLPKKSEIDRHLPTGVRVYGYTSDDMRCYASACISHATTAKNAETETQSDRGREVEAVLAKLREVLGVDGTMYQQTEVMIRALAQKRQEITVTDAMVERACKMGSTFYEDDDSVWPDDYDNADEVRSLARRMITAALVGDSDNDR